MPEKVYFSKKRKEKNLAICLTHSPSGNFAEKRVWKLVERFPAGWSLPSYEELKLTQSRLQFGHVAAF